MLALDFQHKSSGRMALSFRALGVLLQVCCGIAHAEESDPLACTVDLLSHARTSVGKSNNGDLAPKGVFEVAPDGAVRLDPPSADLGSLSDSQGNLLLFRVIGGPYKPGFAGLYAKSEKKISTSVSPEIAIRWAGDTSGNNWKDSPDWDRLLVLRQNVKRDKLTTWRRLPEGKFIRIDRPDGSYQTGACRWPVDSLTKVSDLSVLWEIQVPLDRQNVVVSIKKSDFIKIYRGLGGRSFTGEELLKKLFSSHRQEWPELKQGAKTDSPELREEVPSPDDSVISPTGSALY